MPIPDWTGSEDWDVLFIGGRRAPGTARVTVSMDSGLDVKKPKGSKKAKVVDEGVHPASVHIELEMMSDELEEFEAEIVPLLRPRTRTGPRQPVEISHPNARLWGVNAIMVGDISSPMPKPGGTMSVAFKCVEWTAKTTKQGKQKTKPDGNEDDGWNVQPLIDRLRPSKSGAAFEAVS